MRPWRSRWQKLGGGVAADGFDEDREDEAGENEMDDGAEDGTDDADETDDTAKAEGTDETDDADEALDSRQTDAAVTPAKRARKNEGFILWRVR